MRNWKLSGGSSGDVATLAAGYSGGETDVVTIAADVAPEDYFIRTYANADRINTTGGNRGSTYLIYTGVGADLVTGGDGDESVFDGSGKDRCVLGAGEDAVFAGAGDDLYDGGAGLVDTISFRLQPTDQLSVSETSARVKIDLTLKTGQNLGTTFGTDIVINFENVATGNGADTIKGTGGANEIRSNGGADFIDGRGGADTIFSGEGRDILVGGGGADTFTLREDVNAIDTIKYSAVAASVASTALQYLKSDRIFQFDATSSQSDNIDLSGFSGSFTFVTGPAFSTNMRKEVRIESKNVDGDSLLDTIIHVDTDSDRADEMTIYVMDVTGLAADDFIL